MRKGWAAVILQRTKQRIGVDLIARASQITAAVIAAEVVSKRRDGAAVIEDVFARCAGIQDCVGDLNDLPLPSCYKCLRQKVPSCR